MVAAPNADVSTIYVAKYNRFVDTILGRINKILRDKYDPVTVKLTNPSTSTKSKTKNKTKASSNKNKKTKRRKSSSSSKRRTRKSKSDVAATRDEEMMMLQNSNATASGYVQQTQQQTLTQAPKISATSPSTSESTVAIAVASTAAASIPSTASTELPTRLVSNVVSATGSNRGTNASGTSTKRKKNKTRAPSKSGQKNKKPSAAASTTNKIKSPAPQSTKPKRTKSKARATLYGLSSLKRSGDVSVNMMSDHTTIRTKFNLGPLVLKVEKEFSRSTRKEVRSATATTAEMSGRLSLRVYHGGAATLHSIRVLQPKQMRIESADDHDRTREFVWKRSSHIAHLVSQKLSSATRSMLRPPPAYNTETVAAAAAA